MIIVCGLTVPPQVRSIFAAIFIGDDERRRLVLMWWWFEEEEDDDEEKTATIVIPVFLQYQVQYCNARLCCK